MEHEHTCHCCEHCEEEASEKGLGFDVARLAVAAGLFVAGVLLRGVSAGFWLYLAAAVCAGYDVVWAAVRNIPRGRFMDEHFLMSAAAIGAVALGEAAEGAAVLILYQIGELLSDAAAGRARQSVAKAMDMRQDYANLQTADGLKRVPPGEVSVGAIIAVKPGERVPLDGVVAEGRSSLDTAMLTGEPLPKDVQPGDDVLSGCINATGLLMVRVTKTLAESTVTAVLNMTREAAGRKARAERLMTRFARVYTPIVVFAAIALAVVPAFFGQGFWIHRALVFLVASCPCALVISIPLGLLAGVGALSKRGVLVKGGAALDQLASVDAVAFDKTGTLTTGVFDVTEIAPATGHTRDELLHYAACAEGGSNHPLAAAVLRAYGKPSPNVDSHEELAGRGARVVVNGQTVLAGSASLMAENGVSAEISGGVCIYVSVDGAYIGRIQLADAVKPDAAAAIAGLRGLGISPIVLITGDGAVAEADWREMGMDAVHGGLLPGGKLAVLETLGEHAAFVGDGMNDAPALARAAVGVAMGGLGSGAAVEAADVCVMTDEPAKLPLAIRAARHTRGVVNQNIVFALGVKAVVLAMGAMGYAPMWAAVFADVGVTLLAVLNATRAGRVR